MHVWYMHGTLINLYYLVLEYQVSKYIQCRFRYIIGHIITLMAITVALKLNQLHSCLTQLGGQTNHNPLRWFRKVVSARVSAMKRKEDVIVGPSLNWKRRKKKSIFWAMEINALRDKLPKIHQLNFKSEN